MHSKSKLDYGLIGCCGCALFLRAAVLVAGFSAFDQDPDSYARLAINWANSGTLGIETPEGTVRPTAYRPPFYPWLLSWFVFHGELSTAAVVGLHWLVGVSTVVLVFAISRRLLGTHAWLPAMAVAVDPLLLRSSQLLMTETLAAFWVALVWWLWLAASSRRSQLAASMFVPLVLGLALGAAILTRPTAAPWALLCVIGLCFRSFYPPGDRLRTAGVVVFGVSICVVPWATRNFLVLGQPIWATTHGGYTLLLANNPSLYDHFERSGPSRNWDSQPFHAAWAARGKSLGVNRVTDTIRPTTDKNKLSENTTLHPTDADYWLADNLPTTFPRPTWGELQDDRLAYQAARATISRRPQLFLLSCFYRAGWFWAVWPNSGGWAARLIGVWYAVWLGIVLFAVGRSRFACLRLVGVPAIALVVTLTAIHSVYWGNMRMRAPLMAVVYVGATLGCLNVRSHPVLEPKSD